MRFSTFFSAALAVVAPIAEASSNIRNPLSALSEVNNATIHTGNHRVHAYSQFDLSFNIRDELLVKFSLEPNHNILGEGAVITHLAPDGSVRHVEEVDRQSHKVFKGTSWVKRLDKKEDRWRRAGWARVLVSQDGKTPLFEGAFTVDRDHHHVQSSHNYLRTRHRLDPEIERAQPGSEYMVVWRDSDVTSTQDGIMHQGLKRELQHRSGTPRVCFHAQAIRQVFWNYRFLQHLQATERHHGWQQRWRKLVIHDWRQLWLPFHPKGRSGGCGD
jgi:hypothetical protein